MSAPRVLMTADSVGGVLSYAEDLCRGLAHAGVEVLLAVMGGELDADRRAPFERLRGVQVESSNYALEWMEEPWADVSAAGAWLLELADRFHPDLVHLNGYAHASLPWRKPVLVVAHSCVSSWFEAVKGEPLPSRFAVYDRELRTGLRAADAIVAPSTFMASALERHYGPGLEGVSVIPNGVWLEDYELAKKEAVILAAGRLWDEAKNLALLADIAPRLPWPVHVAGETHEGRLPGTDRGLPSGVSPLGRLGRRELAAVMSRAAIFVHVARYEPFGLAPLEAAASGCALVLSDIPTFRALWAGAAPRVGVHDAIGLERVLVTLCTSTERRGALGARALSRSRLYDARAMTRSYLDLYRELTGSDERSRREMERRVG
jgi:glycosyltransferase involved in cell wall biosynthesis